MVLDPIPQSLPVHFFGSRPQPPTSPSDSACRRRHVVALRPHTPSWPHIHTTSQPHTHDNGPNISCCMHQLTRHNTLRHTATHCITLQHTASHCITLQHTTTHYNTMQHTTVTVYINWLDTTHCITLQHTTTHYNTMQHTTVTVYINWLDIILFEEYLIFWYTVAVCPFKVKGGLCLTQG